MGKVKLGVHVGKTRRPFNMFSLLYINLSCELFLPVKWNSKSRKLLKPRLHLPYD